MRLRCPEQGDQLGIWEQWLRHKLVTFSDSYKIVTALVSFSDWSLNSDQLVTLAQSQIAKQLQFAYNYFVTMSSKQYFKKTRFLVE